MVKECYHILLNSQFLESHGVDLKFMSPSSIGNLRGTVVGPKDSIYDGEECYYYSVR